MPDPRPFDGRGTRGSLPPVRQTSKPDFGGRLPPPPMPAQTDPRLIQREPMKNTTTILIGSGEVKIRALWAKETDLIDEAYPRPIAPMMKNPNAGSESPPIPNEADPKHQAELRRWVKAVMRSRVAMSLEPNTDGWDEAKLKAMVGELITTYTEEHINVLSAAAAQFSAARMVSDALKALVIAREPKAGATSGVGVVDLNEADKIDIPDQYDDSQAMLDLRICERFGQAPGWEKTLSPDDQAKARAYELVRLGEQRKATSLLQAVAALVA